MNGWFGRAGWIALSAVVVAVAGCGGAAGDDAASQDPGSTTSDGFRFVLTEVIDADLGPISKRLEGVIDPVTSTGSAEIVDGHDAGPDPLLLVDGVHYLPIPGFGDDDDAPAFGPCAAKRYVRHDPEEFDADAEIGRGLLMADELIQIDLERMYELIASGPPVATVEHDGEDTVTYAVDPPDEVVNPPIDDEFGLGPVRQLHDLTATVDAEDRITIVEWEVTVGAGREVDRDGETTAVRLEMSDFGSPVDVTLPADDDVCDYFEMSQHAFCTFESAELNQPVVDAIEAGDREAVRVALDDLCPDALDVPRYVEAARCDPAMVTHFFDELGLDPDSSILGVPALLQLTRYFPESDCTPEQDLATVQALLDAGADPCAAPEGPDWDGQPWEPAATGIADWDVAPGIVAAVESAAADC